MSKKYSSKIIYEYYKYLEKYEIEYYFDSKDYKAFPVEIDDNKIIDNIYKNTLYDYLF